MPPNEILANLKSSKLVKRIVSCKFDGIGSSYILKIRAELINGWLLDCWEHRTADLRRYSFHVFQQNQMIVRWDNSPQYPELNGFPHHKHEGKDIMGSEEMTVDVVLRQLERIISNSSNLSAR